MLFVISPQFVLQNGPQFTLSLLCSCGKNALEEEPCQTLWVALVGSEEEEILQLTADLVSGLRSMLEDLASTQLLNLNVEERLNRICSAVLSFRDFSADVIYVLDSPESSNAADVKVYFDNLHSSLRPNVAHLSDIQFLLNSSFGEFVGCFGEDGFGVRITDALIGYLVDMGCLSLSEFISGSVIPSFAQQLGNLNSSQPYSINTDRLVNKSSSSTLQTRKDNGKRKRSLSPICVSGSFGPNNESEMDLPMSSDFDQSTTASEPGSVVGNFNRNESQITKRRKKDTNYNTNGSSNASTTRAAKLLKLSQSSSVNGDGGSLESGWQKEKLDENLTNSDLSSKLLPDNKGFEQISSKTSLEFCGNGSVRETQAEKSRGGFREFFHNCYGGQKFYSRDERCELLGFDDQTELFKFIDKQLQLLPDQISLIGLTQLQHAVFQLIAYLWKNSTKEAQWRSLEQFTEFVCGSTQTKCVEKLIVICFELHRYTNSCGFSNVPAVENFTITLQEQLGTRSECDEFQTALRKFVKQSFTEWYFQRAAKRLALDFLTKMFSFDAKNQYFMELSNILADQYTAIAEQAVESSDSELSDNDLDLSINNRKCETSVANYSSSEDVFNSSVNAIDDSRRDSNGSAVAPSNHPINRIKNRFSTRSSSSVRLMLEQNATKPRKSTTTSVERNRQSAMESTNLLSYSQSDSTKLLAKLDKPVHVKESVKLQSKMLQRSLSQSFRLSSQSSVDNVHRPKIGAKQSADGKISSTKSSLVSVSKSSKSSTGTRDIGKRTARKSPANSILKSAQKKLSLASATKVKENGVRFSSQAGKQRPVSNSKTPAKESLVNTRHGSKMRSSNRLRGKKLLTKKVLETPGAKLKSRLLGKADDNQHTQLSNKRSSSYEQSSVSKITETPANKMPKTVAPEELKHRNRIRRSISTTAGDPSSLFGASTKLGRRDSFYKTTDSSKRGADNSCSSTAVASGSQANVHKSNDLGANSSYESSINENVSESVDLGTSNISPYSLFFKPNEHGKVNELILTPAKHFDEALCESVSSVSSGTGETPLRGIFPIKNSNGKSIQAIHGVGTLSLVDSTSAKEWENDKENEPPANGHLTRSTTKIHQFRNVKLASASKVQKPAANVRKSLFSGRNSTSSQHSPKKFTAKSSFHDDKPTTVYKIFCEDSLSMDYLTELVNEKSEEPQTSENRNLVNVEEHGSNKAEGSNSVSAFDFKLKKRLPMFDTDNSAMQSSMSPSPLSSKTSNGSSRVFTKNEMPCYLPGGQKNDVSAASRKCGNLSRALDELLKNPFVSPRITGTSPV